MVYQNNYATYLIWKIWQNIKAVAASIRAIVFAYTYKWFFKSFCLQQTNVLKDYVFSELKTMHPHDSDERVLRILEIGTGPGSNFPYFPSKCKYISVDTNTYFQSMLLKNLKKYPGIDLENYINCRGENISMIASNSVHAVVTSHVHCSATDNQQVLKEIKRVLVPGGAYYFFEHVLDKPGTFRYKFQKASNKIGFQQIIGHGCRFVNFEKELQQVFSSYTGQWYYLPESWDFNLFLYPVKSNFGGKAIKSI